MKQCWQVTWRFVTISMEMNLILIQMDQPLTMEYISSESNR